MIREVLEQIVTQERSDSYSRPTATTNIASAGNGTDEMTSPDAPPAELSAPREGPQAPDVQSPPSDNSIPPEAQQPPQEPQMATGEYPPPQAISEAAQQVAEIAPPSDSPLPPDDQPPPPQELNVPPDDLRPAEFQAPEPDLPPPPQDVSLQPEYQEPAREPDNTTVDLSPVKMIPLDAQFAPLGDWDEMFPDDSDLEEMEQRPIDDLGFDIDLHQRRID